LHVGEAFSFFDDEKENPESQTQSIFFFNVEKGSELQTQSIFFS
jgi:hypothetical protein